VKAKTVKISKTRNIVKAINLHIYFVSTNILFRVTLGCWIPERVKDKPLEINAGAFYRAILLLSLTQQ